MRTETYLVPRQASLVELSAVDYSRNKLHLIWNKAFKSGPSKICGRQPLKNFTWSTLECFVPYLERGSQYVFEDLVKKHYLAPTIAQIIPNHSNHFQNKIYCHSN